MANRGSAEAQGSEKGRLALDERLPLRVGLSSAFAGVIGYARAMVDEARRDPVRAVHEYRKALRRARAVLRLSRPLLGEGCFRELLHELRLALRGTSPLRDAAVMAQTLQGLPDLVRTRRARRAMRELLAVEARSDASAERIALELSRSAQIVAPLPVRFLACLPQDVRWRQVREALERSLKRARRARREARRGGEDQQVHAFRKRVKELRYQLELLEAAQPGKLRRDHRDLATLAEALGEVTDLTLLRRFVRLRAQEIEAARPAALVACLDSLVQRRLQAALAASRRLFARHPRDFAKRAVRRFR